MREILFRGKRKDNGEWVEGAFCPKSCDGLFDPMIDRPSIIKLDEPNDGFWFDVDPDTVGQYAGRPDKNGRKLFEHDIVRFDGGTFVVEFSASRIGFYFCGIHGRGCVPGFAMAHWEHIEVIGNIHDNPELLKGENHG